MIRDGTVRISRLNNVLVYRLFFILLFRLKGVKYVPPNRASIYPRVSPEGPPPTIRIGISSSACSIVGNCG